MAGMDRRVARTRSQLQQAMLELLGERDLDDITVADLVARADVNRSTFYQHYEDRHALLADAIDAAMTQDQATLPPLPGEVGCEPPSALVHYLQHFEAHARLYARVFGDHGSPLAVARLQRRVAELAAEAIEESGDGVFEGMPVQVAAAGLAGSVIGVLGAWISHDPRPDVQTAAEWIWRVLSEPGASAIPRTET
jgi:AcrR family transcriptional regulator